MGIELKRFPHSPALYAYRYNPEPGETAVQIPDGVTDLAMRLFYQQEVSAVTLPDSLERIEIMAFCECKNLTQITLPPYLREIAESAFAGSALKQIVIPDRVRKLGRSFQYCESLETVVLPRKLRELERGMFHSCLKLKNVTMPETLEIIGDRAFTQTALETAVLPSALRQIGENAFERCLSLRQAVLPEGLEQIGKDAFRCTALQRVRIPESVTKIGFHAFDAGVTVEICTGGNTIIPLTLEDDWGFDEQDQFVSVRNPQDSEYAEHYSTLLKRAARQLIAPNNQAKLIQLVEDKRISPELIAACIAQSAEQEILPLTARLMDTLNSEFQINEKRFRL